MANPDAQAGMLGVARAIASRDRGEADSPMRRTVAAGMLAAVGVAVLATMPGRVDRSSEIRGDFPRTADSSGSLRAASGRGVREDAVSSLRRDDMKSTVAGLAIAVASTASAVPPGWVLVADSQAQFSGVQGQDGWRYLFDRGEGTAVEQMPYFTPYNGAPGTGTLVWCPEPLAGFGGSFCMLWPAMAHTNQAYVCDTPLAGLQRPIRRWTLGRASALHVTVQADLGASFTSALRADLLANGATLATWLTQYGSTPTINASFDLVATSQIEFRLDPVDGCAADGCNNLNIRIYAPDCDSSGRADLVEIIENPAIDADGDGTIDSCQCPADLNRDGQVNGADIGFVLFSWGPNPAFPAADIDRSGAVDGLDLALLLAAWGPCGQ
jgi:hypothetical protein